MIDAVNQRTGITGGNKEFLELERNSATVIEKLEEEIIPQDALIKRWKRKVGEYLMK